METLNEAQRRAVAAGDGPTLVLAGAGTGKTRIIVERLAWLVRERGVDPGNLLAMTFTNRAAEEMRSRVAARLQAERVPLWVGTFHSFGLFMLRHDKDKLGRQSSITVFDDADQLSLMKRLIQELPHARVRVSPRDALHWVSRLKQNLVEPDAEDCSSEEEKTFHELWARYHAALEQMGAVDFDDLLALPVRLLETFPEVRERYQRRFLYIHVDEYQDTNRAQYRMVRQLSGTHGNLFVVGDEDQSIYSWRGADVRNILEFEQDFPQAKVFRIEQNYRSTAPILAAANAVVTNNRERLGKTLWTNHSAGEPVRFYLAEDGEDEARFVVDTMVARGMASKDVAVLFRTNAQSRLMEEALRRKGLAHVVVGGVQFYSRKEIKEVLSYLRLLVNPRDDAALRRIINVPPRGIGTATLERLEQYAAARGVPLMQVLREAETDQGVPGRVRTALSTLVQLMDELTLAAKTPAVAPLAERLLEETGYREYVKRSDERDFRARLEILDEFLAACAQFDQRDGTGLAAFVQELALLTDVDEWEAGAPAVTLVTCHSAKGLEFDHVFLIGLEEGLLPHATAFESEPELEEERRLFYVAMTRARESLTLAAAKSRRVYGEKRALEISRFVTEIPAERLERVHGDDGRREGAAKRRMGVTPVDPGKLKTGTQIRHARFGPGIVLYTKGTGSKLRARIRFESGRSRDFMVSAAPLEVFEGDRK